MKAPTPGIFRTEKPGNPGIQSSHRSNARKRGRRPPLCPPPRAIGHTFEFTLSLPEPSNTGGRPPSKEKKSRKENRKSTHRSHPKKTGQPKSSPEPTQAQVEAQKEVRRAYDRQRSQTPERKQLQRRIAQEKRDQRRSLGLCITCHGTPILDQTRCETCAENHRAAQRKDRTSGQTRIF